VRQKKKKKIGEQVDNNGTKKAQLLPMVFHFVLLLLLQERWRRRCF
jgi:hypothetical protein